MHTEVIAEAGVNHNGDMDIAFQLIEGAAESGADSVKFQSFSAEKLAMRNAPKAQYQIESTGSSETQYEMLKRLELSTNEQRELMMFSKSKGIEFLSSPFDVENAVHLIEEIGLQRIKIPSGEIINGPMLFEISSRNVPVVLSTGMCDLSDIERALGVLAYGYLKGKNPNRQECQDAYFSNEGQSALAKNVVLLHCVSQYPAPTEQINLRAIETLQRTFGLPVGFSDHTSGITIALAAASLGACVLEKHFTLSRAMPGPDHSASLEVKELKQMVTEIRLINKALGDGRKRPALCELENRQLVRKSAVACRDVVIGQKFTMNDFEFLRPGGGFSPMDAWDLVGASSPKNFAKGEIIKL